jgi:hypothetical protein
MSPNRQTELDSAGSEPNPCSSTQASTLAAIKPYVTIGVKKCGLSSRIGNIARVSVVGAHGMHSCMPRAESEHGGRNDEEKAPRDVRRVTRCAR